MPEIEYILTIEYTFRLNCKYTFVIIIHKLK